MRLLKSNYHQQCTIWAGFLYKICFWGKPSGVSRSCLWPTLAERCRAERKKGNEKSGRDLWGRGEHSDFFTCCSSSSGTTCQKPQGRSRRDQGHGTWRGCGTGRGSVPLPWPMSLPCTNPSASPFHHFPQEITDLPKQGWEGLQHTGIINKYSTCVYRISWQSWLQWLFTSWLESRFLNPCQ